MKYSCLCIAQLVLIMALPLLSGADPARARFVRVGDTARGNTASRDRYVAWSRLPRSQKVSIQKNYAQFSRLPVDQKAAMRSHFEHWKQLPPGRRQDLRMRLKKWQNMPEAERARLRERCADQSCRGKQPVGRNGHQ